MGPATFEFSSKGALVSRLAGLDLPVRKSALPGVRNRSDAAHRLLSSFPDRLHDLQLRRPDRERSQRLQQRCDMLGIEVLVHVSQVAPALVDQVAGRIFGIAIE